MPFLDFFDILFPFASCRSIGYIRDYFMKKSVTKRIRITRTGKIMRRRMGGDHFHARKSKNQNRRKRLGSILNKRDVKAIIGEMARLF